MTPHLIDGYNLLYAFAEIPPGTLEAKRDAVLAFLKTRRPQGRNPAIVVFDSRDGAGSRRRQGDLEIVFTPGGSADAWIALYLRAAKNARSFVVVTNDQGIRRMIKGTGAKWMSADAFLQRSQRRDQPSAPEAGTALDAAAERDAITKDLMREWL